MYAMRAWSIRRGYAMVTQVSCRDRNRIAIQGDVLGAAAMGVANILCLTGDGVQAGDHPEAKPVFDLDCMSALQMPPQVARVRKNTFEALVKAAKVCSLGSMSHALYDVGGEYRRNM